MTVFFSNESKVLKNVVPSLVAALTLNFITDDLTAQDTEIVLVCTYQLSAPGWHTTSHTHEWILNLQHGTARGRWGGTLRLRVTPHAYRIDRPQDYSNRDYFEMEISRRTGRVEGTLFSDVNPRELFLQGSCEPAGAPKF